MEKRKLSPEEVAFLGMSTNHEQMPNAEYRLRLMCADGSGYIRTVAGPKGEWQNSHYHTGVREFIAVQTGWIAIAEFRDGQLVIRVLSAGAFIVSEPNVHHNVYMSARTVTHCVKFGDTAAEKASGKADWHASHEVDRLTKHLPEDEILSIAVE
ncbi:MAG TPA: hypothetical protein VLK22_03770 [Candidatus Udaeobacter sp.]|nr:hypothetical protein [Candidatus Udaeobacter sp.]